MIFNEHLELEGQHAFLSASKYHWINYDEDKVADSFRKFLAIQRGTRLHEIACRLIQEGIRLPKSRLALNAYVNDAIGYKMKPEQKLVYSRNCFGTADAIGFRKNFLRIHDFKSGLIPASMHQLEVYAALFCLEYRFKPQNIKIELRLYQFEEVLIHEPPPEEIMRIMEKIIAFDKRIEYLIINEGE